MHYSVHPLWVSISSCLFSFVKIGFVSTFFEAINISLAATTSACGKLNVLVVGFYVSSL